ncbi:hypothetical protein FISHEDRAFT_70749 [Fistulina hepatica ATCC 64428]|uniref:Uncharacterized protein n=1 Tax=Fistulina hepatica ATCC 64428 TaxID=1128425 RepID=A0A0D7AI24_9AGAR|nr:hypothetical protein FISHEDRAFT_70749 [Fistulina hepatica ATCC 64428]
MFTLGEITQPRPVRAHDNSHGDDTEQDLARFRRFLEVHQPGYSDDDDSDDGEMYKDDELVNESALNLGAETPGSTLEGWISERAAAASDSWSKYDVSMHTDVPPRRALWRSASFSEKKARAQGATGAQSTDRLCGIWLIIGPAVLLSTAFSFETARHACRTSCCGHIFCTEHISEWLCHTSFDDCCPACQTPAMLNDARQRSRRDEPARMPSHSPPRSSHSSRSSSRRRSASRESCEASANSAATYSTSESEDAEARLVATNLQKSVLEPEVLPNIIGKVLSILALMIVYHYILA